MIGQIMPINAPHKAGIEFDRLVVISVVWRQIVSMDCRMLETDVSGYKWPDRTYRLD